MSSSTTSQLQQQNDGISEEQRIVYPQIDSELSSSSAAGRWGTSAMGSPSKPQAHPQNKQAATWNPVPMDAQAQNGQWAHNQIPTPTSTGYANDSQYPAIAHPYIITTPAPAFPGKSSMDNISDYLSKWSKKFEGVAKKAEGAAGNVWQHLKTGPNIADTAWGKISYGTKLLTEGGYEKIFRQMFETLPEEKFLKSYACYLSTSAGPVSGTLYISTKRIAFCSDRPLSYKLSAGGQTSWSYYKVVVPLDRLQAVNASSDPSNGAEKYIQMQTVDNHEFWYMGFVNYDKALKNLREARLHRS